jgi:catalase (peroxidase I)
VNAEIITFQRPTCISAQFYNIQPSQLLSRRQAVEAAIRSYIPDCNNEARMIFRAAFHDVGTYDQRTKTGGADGSLQFEGLRAENFFVRPAIKIVKDLSTTFRISVADALMLSTHLSLEVCGGPKLKTFVFGRKDAAGENLPNLLLPNDATVENIIEAFITRMGYTAEETIALIGGGHSIAHTRRQGMLLDKPLDSTPSRLDIVYFQELLKSPDSAITLRHGRIKSDSNMLQNAEFRALIEKFAASADDFAASFGPAVEKMLNMGAVMDPTQNAIMDQEFVTLVYTTKSSCAEPGDGNDRVGGGSLSKKPEQSSARDRQGASWFIALGSSALIGVMVL